MLRPPIARERLEHRPDGLVRDAITDEQALSQAAHHAPQLRLYGRGLSQALGQPVRERLVLFTALGRTVPV